ncbi:MAG: hypothetical protein A2V62_05720 [Nitrospirae bacterium RBG_19FT_COMBO_58_9]|nr:MAG: hypothetical protein A2V62_05720 [Nitrospirae bacterium RBG_19FT_COMBO_58_9]
MNQTNQIDQIGRSPVSLVSRVPLVSLMSSEPRTIFMHCQYESKSLVLPDTTRLPQEIGGGVLLTFAKTGARQPEEPGVAVQRSSEKILDLLRKSPTLATREVVQQLGISQHAVEKQIDTLKREGCLRRVGPAKGGYWEVRETL